MGLATLLERTNTYFFKVEFQKIFLFFLWLNLCLKVGDNEFGVSTKGLTLCRVHILVQDVSILLRINKYILAVLLVLVKCLDNKMVKSPGWPSVGFPSCV